LAPFPRDLVKPASIAVRHRLPAAEHLPTLADDIGVTRIQFHQARPTLAALASNQGGA
jgi:hypothetical protein